MTIWKFFTAPSKKVCRISASDAASLNRPRPATDGALDAGAVEQLAPAAGGFRVRDVDGLGVERRAAARAGPRR